MAVEKERMDVPSRAPTATIAEYLRGSVSVSKLIKLAWAGRLVVLAAALAGLTFGIYTVHHDGPRYMATMRVSPPENDSSAGILGNGGGGSGALGLLADLTGGNVTVVPKFTQFLFGMGSIDVAKELDRKYNMVCRVYADECDLSTRQWHMHVGFKEWVDGIFARIGRLPDPNGPRTADHLANYITQSILNQQNKQNSIVVITFTHSKPEFAAEFLSRVVQETNNLIRRQDRDNQRRYVQYLAEAAARSTNVEQRQTLDTLLLQQERQLMMTEVDAPYAVSVLEGPNVKPINTVLKTLAIDTLLGIVIGIGLAMCRNLIPRKWRLRQ